MLMLMLLLLPLPLCHACDTAHPPLPALADQPRRMILPLLLLLLLLLLLRCWRMCERYGALRCKEKGDFLVL